MMASAVTALVGRLPLTFRHTDAHRLVLAARVYVGAIIVAGATLFLLCVPRELPNPLFVGSLLAATLLLSVFKLRLPLGNGVSTMSMAYAVDFVALLTAGPDVAMIVAVAGVLLQCTVRVKHAQPVYRTAFSIASIVIAVQAAGWAWRTLGGTLTVPALLTFAVPLSAAAMTYFMVNTALVAGAIGLSKAVSAAREWYREFFWSAPAYFLSAAVGGMIALIVRYDSYVLLPLAAAPLYISYRAYQISVRRIEEERCHASELAKMIATTQEALDRATASEVALAAEKERLALESARLGATLRTISDGVVSADRTGAVLLMNEAAQKLASVGHDGAGMATIHAILASLGLSAAMCRHALQRVLVDGLPVRLRTDPSGDAPAVRLVEVTGTPTRDAERHVTGAVWVLRDVSDMARIEHERAKAARLESLGVLAGGLAHDFNNILMGIVGNLSLAQAMVRAEDAALTVRLTSAAAACSRARGVTNQLLTFSKGGAPVKTTASIDELVTECTRFALSGSPIAPRFDLSGSLWPADVDTTQIGQVVQNLVLNAMQAMPRGGVIDVSLQNVELELDSLPAHTALSPGRYVCLSVRDTGKGIPPEHLGRIFDPYFTTKEKGSGLGLAISYSIVRAHGGAITVESEVGVGTQFAVYLPASTRRVAEAAPVRVEVRRGVSGRVLLMDDEPLVAEVAQEMLESLGYAARVSSSGADAIACFREAESRGEPFDAVILDLTVPGGMGGSEALPHIKDLRPDVPVLVMSGYADDSVLARYRDYGFDGVLPKPFAIPDLRKALQEAESNRQAKASTLPLIEAGSLSRKSRFQFAIGD